MAAESGTPGGWAERAEAEAQRATERFKRAEQRLEVAEELADGLTFDKQRAEAERDEWQTKAGMNRADYLREEQRHRDEIERLAGELSEIRTNLRALSDPMAEADRIGQIVRRLRESIKPGLSGAAGNQPPDRSDPGERSGPAESEPGLSEGRRAEGLAEQGHALDEPGNRPPSGSAPKNASDSPPLAESVKPEQGLQETAERVRDAGFDTLADGMLEGQCTCDRSKGLNDVGEPLFRNPNCPVHGRPEGCPTCESTDWGIEFGTGGCRDPFHQERTD